MASLRLVRQARCSLDHGAALDVPGQCPGVVGVGHRSNEQQPDRRGGVGPLQSVGQGTKVTIAMTLQAVRPSTPG